jgi:hypothetical protein
MNTCCKKDRTNNELPIQGYSNETISMSEFKRVLLKKHNDNI